MTAHITIPVTVKQMVKEEKNFPIPSFYKTQFNHFGFIDENTVCLVRLSDNFSVIQNGTPERMEDLVSMYVNEFVPCTEDEFMNTYSEAYEAMRLEPKEVLVQTYGLEKVVTRKEKTY